MTITILFIVFHDGGLEIKSVKLFQTMVRLHSDVIGGIVLC